MQASNFAAADGGKSKAIVADCSGDGFLISFNSLHLPTAARIQYLGVYLLPSGPSIPVVQAAGRFKSCASSIDVLSYLLWFTNYIVSFLLPRFLVPPVTTSCSNARAP